MVVQAHLVVLLLTILGENKVLGDLSWETPLQGWSHQASYVE
jgi:hypothetical protein